MTMKDDINLNNSPSKRKKRSKLRRAPQAPKRFRSSFILYNTQMKVNIKADLGSNASVRPLLTSLNFRFLFIFL